MIQDELKTAGCVENDEQIIERREEDSFEIKTDLWEDPGTEPIYVLQHCVQRQQFYTGDA